MSASLGIFEITQSRRRLFIRFSSSMVHIDEVCRSVNRFLKSRGNIMLPHLFSINLVMREGLTNAVRHGNKNDPEKLVDIELELVRDRILKVCISDEGEGFDWQKVESEEMPEDSDHGRGVPIMKAYFNLCQYNQKGNILYLEKHLYS